MYKIVRLTRISDANKRVTGEVVGLMNNWNMKVVLIKNIHNQNSILMSDNPQFKLVFVHSPPELLSKMNNFQYIPCN